MKGETKTEFIRFIIETPEKAVLLQQLFTVRAWGVVKQKLYYPLDRKTFLVKNLI